MALDSGCKRSNTNRFSHLKYAVSEACVLRTKWSFGSLNARSRKWNFTKTMFSKSWYP